MPAASVGANNGEHNMYTVTNVDLAAAAIVRAARANPCITAAGLQDELERGDIDGWMPVVRRWNLTFAQWSGAMERAIDALQ